jgi:hypothetical protein
VATIPGYLAPASLDGLVILSLSMDHAGLVSAVHEQTDLSCPVFLTETNGILRVYDEIGNNIDLMEKGRGSEY